MRLLFFILSATAVLAAERAPLLVFLPGSAGAQPPQVAARGWELAVVEASPDDRGVKAIEEAIRHAAGRGEIDADRIYVAAQGSPAVFYAISRRPDLWAAALDLGGSPKPAIETNRLFGANAAAVPLLWLVHPQDRAALDPLREKLAAAGFNLEPRPAADVTLDQLLDWLGAHKRDPVPQKVDFETGSAQFPRCFWVEVSRFDPAARNDALESTRVAPGSGAALALGGFGFNLSAPGPGVLVSWLPENYKGPLKLDDRIVAISGKEIPDARGYAELMDQEREEKRVGIMLLRGKERLRIETRVVLPKREEQATARVRAEFLSDTRELLVISRGAGELRLALPPYWAPCTINWNGEDAGQADAAGCWALSAGAKARRCE